MKVSFGYVVILLFGCLQSCVPSRRTLPDELREVSGAVRTPDGTYVTLNDGGNAASLYRLTANGQAEAVPLDIPNVDWEALAQYEDGTLCICDIGDNRKQRDHVDFYLVEGPSTRQLQRNYPDGAHNAEACFIYDHQLYVLSKARVGWQQREKPAYLYRVDTLASGPQDMTLVDSLVLRRRVVTGASVLPASNRLAIVSYDFGRVLNFFPRTRPSVFTVELSGQGGFRQNTLRERRIRAPFALTQYEAIAPTDDADEVIIFSEKTLWLPARQRRVSLPKERSPKVDD